MNAERASGALVESANSLIGAGFGDECRMNKLERQSIEDSLSNILARIEPAALEAVSQWTDPLVLGMGLFSWGTRIAKVLRERELAQAEEAGIDTAPSVAPSPAPARTNGKRPGEIGYIPDEGDYMRALGGGAL